MLECNILIDTGFVLVGVAMARAFFDGKSSLISGGFRKKEIEIRMKYKNIKDESST